MAVDTTGKPAEDDATEVKEAEFHKGGCGQQCTMPLEKLGI